MEPSQLNWIANFIWGIADDVLRDLYVRGKYRDVILPMTVLRRIDSLLEQFSDNEGFRRWLTDTVFGLTYDRPEAGGLIDV